MVGVDFLICIPAQKQEANLFFSIHIMYPAKPLYALWMDSSTCSQCRSPIPSLPELLYGIPHYATGDMFPCPFLSEPFCSTAGHKTKNTRNCEGSGCPFPYLASKMCWQHAHRPPTPEPISITSPLLGFQDAMPNEPSKLTEKW